MFHETHDFSRGILGTYHGFAHSQEHHLPIRSWRRKSSHEIAYFLPFLETGFPLLVCAGSIMGLRSCTNRLTYSRVTSMSLCGISFILSSSSIFLIVITRLKTS